MRFLQRHLNHFGLFLIVWGAGAILYACAVLGPSTQRLVRLTLTSLDHTTHSIAEFQEHLGLVTRTQTALAASGALLSTLPSTFADVRGSLKGGARATVQGGEAAKKSQEGVAGLVLPKEPIQGAAKAMKATGAELGELSSKMKKTQRVIGTLGEEVLGLSDELDHWIGDAEVQRANLGQLELKLREVHGALNGLHIPFDVVGLGVTLGLICIALGIGFVELSKQLPFSGRV